MPDIVQLNQSIEGDKIDGFCRDPIRYHRQLRKNGINYFEFIADFNVKSWIYEILSAERVKIDSSSITQLGYQIVCDKASITSIKQKYNQNIASNVTSTHGARCWGFPNQTNVKIMRCHQELINAIQKRENKYVK